MTRTSATGADLAQAGFTLVELMVVLAIMGLMASVVVMATAGGRPTVALEAERFAARLVSARDEAVLTNAMVEVAVSARGYAFRKRAPGGWTDLEEGPFRATEWSPETALASASSEDRVTFDPTGVATPATYVLARGERASRVVVDTAGNVRIDAPTSR